MEPAAQESLTLAPSPTPLPLHQLQALQAQLQALGSGALAPLPGAPLPLQLPDPFARPLVFSIGDRQVYVENGSAPPSVYALSRRWAFCDSGPTADQREPPPPVVARPLPDDPAAGEGAGPPVYPDVSEEYDSLEALCRLKQHWTAARTHNSAQRRANARRYHSRLAALLAGDGGGPDSSAPPLSAPQQQQGQPGQHQQGQQGQQQGQPQQQQGLQGELQQPAQPQQGPIFVRRTTVSRTPSQQSLGAATAAAAIAPAPAPAASVPAT